MLDIIQSIDLELVREVIFVVAFFALLIFAIINELKKRGVLTEGQAAPWVVRISALLSVIDFVLAQFLGGGGLPEDIPELAGGLGAMTATLIALVLGSKLIYELMKWIGAAKSFSEEEKREAMKLLTGSSTSAMKAINQPAPHPGMPAAG